MVLIMTRCHRTTSHGLCWPRWLLSMAPLYHSELTHWGRVTHICVGDLTIIASDNGLSPGWRQAIIWTNAGILLMGPLGTNFSEILIQILIFSFKNMRLKASSAKLRPFCTGNNELNQMHHPVQNTLVYWAYKRMNKDNKYTCQEHAYSFMSKKPALNVLTCN